jgi:hypothetical protein
MTGYSTIMLIMLIMLIMEIPGEEKGKEHIQSRLRTFAQYQI